MFMSHQLGSRRNKQAQSKVATVTQTYRTGNRLGKFNDEAVLKTLTSVSLSNQSPAANFFEPVVRGLSPLPSIILVPHKEPQAAVPACADS
jgi:hypothetical protein